MQLYLYADHESTELLATARPKALLIGGDFGYGSFGDVLQHLGAVKHVRAWTDFAVVSLFALDALSRQADAESLRKRHGVDALLFASEVAIDPDEAAELGLRPVDVVCNTSFVYLYGGGYLNELRGDFVLQCAEHFLARLGGIPYVMSGQQLPASFVRQIREHVDRCEPLLVGMRDGESLHRAIAEGIDADFSFDDAVEPILDMRRKTSVEKGDGAFIHLGTSGHAEGDAALTEMAAHLRLIAARIGEGVRPVLVQASQDVRGAVIDTIETVNRMKADFPFTDVETILLVNSILGDQAEGASSRLLTGRFGYSSSYHVALWLQLHGIPCWLHSSSPHDVQKRTALGIEGGFENFLEHMQCPDHGEKLQARCRWLDKLRQVIGSIAPATNRIDWEVPDAAASAQSFSFKGEPRHGRQLQEAWDAQGTSQQEIEWLGSAIGQMMDRLAAVDARLQEALARERDLTERLLACNDQLTTVGQDARYYSDEYRRARASLQVVSTREHELAGRMQEILCSRSWRWTRPFRVGSRYFRTGRFDPAGTVGLFGALRAIGRRLPISQSLRSKLGEMLARFRRR